MNDDRMDEDDKINGNDVYEDDKGDLGVQDVNVNAVVGVYMGRSEDVPEGGGGHGDEARSSAEDEIWRERKRTGEEDNMEDMSRRREKEDQRRHSRSKMTESDPKLQNIELVRKTELSEVGTRNKERKEDDRKRMGRMVSVTLSPTLKRKVSGIKLHEEGTFKTLLSDNGTGHVRLCKG